MCGGSLATETEYCIAVPCQPGQQNGLGPPSSGRQRYHAAGPRDPAGPGDFEEKPSARRPVFDLARDRRTRRSFHREDLGLLTSSSRNGALLYVDHAHPEYSAPECKPTPLERPYGTCCERVMCGGGVPGSVVPSSRCHHPASKTYRQ